MAKTKEQATGGIINTSSVVYEDSAHVVVFLPTQEPAVLAYNKDNGGAVRVAGGDVDEWIEIAASLAYALAEVQAAA